MLDDELILEPDPARVMEGLRDTGYDFNTAMADLVDNSIAAKATIVKVSVNIDPNNNVSIFIADNGIGMDFEGLKNAMRYGSKQRSEAGSLGKFGLGLKTASTAFCRSLSVLSRSNLSEYNKVQWDLDEIAKSNKWKLLQPKIEEDEIDLLEDVTKGNSGTLVIWDKVDRLMKTYSNKANLRKAFDSLVKKLKFHFAMVYQRFLDENFTDVQNVKIFVNDEEVKPWDPFCKSNDKTKLLAYDNIKVCLPDGKESSFKLNAYLLPRKDDFATKEERQEAHVSNDFEGFYVYRENRLIYFGSWLGMFINDPHIALLRVEFSFDHTLDEAFNVDIKKSRVLLNEEIFTHIKEQFIQAPKREAEAVYRTGETKKIIKNASGAHEASNNNINQKANIIENSKIDIINPEKGEVRIVNPQGTFTGTIKIQSTAQNGQYRVVPVANLENSMLWAPTLVEGHHAVSINQSHSYYTKVYAPVINNKVLVTGMDALLWALSEAELSTLNDEVKEIYMDMRIAVSRALTKLVADLPDPETEDLNEE